MGIMGMRLPARLEAALGRAQAEWLRDELSWKIIIKHKGLTKAEQISLQMWCGMHTPYRLEFVEVAE